LDESLKEKVNAALRIHKLKTTQELAQQFNIELQSSSPLNDSSHSQSSLTVERIASSLSSKSQSHAYSHSHPHYPFTSSANCDAFADETKTSKSELMHRFLSSTSTANAIQHNIDDRHEYSNDNIDIGIDHTQHNHEHYSNYSNYYGNDGTVSQCYPSTAKTKSIDIVGDEIRDILSQLPPLNLSEIAWSDSDLNETNDNDVNVNNDNECVVDHQQTVSQRCEPEVSEARVAKLNGDYKWEYVNGTYDSETDWKDWHQMTSAVSYNGDILHILPYVNIKD